MVPRGIRNNNPGNLEFNAASFRADPWRGELGLEPGPNARFTTFATPGDGIRALCKVLLTYQRKYGLKTVAEIINRWAPPAENDAGAYAVHVRERLGVGAGQVIRLADDAKLLQGLAEAIIAHENGEQPYDDSEVRAGVEAALA